MAEAKKVKKNSKSGGKTNEGLLAHGQSREKLATQFGSVQLKGKGK
jgi:phage repressor protein C with HTH and peptisase S24 domain